jgi:hypothetical protein
MFAAAGTASILHVSAEVAVCAQRLALAASGRDAVKPQKRNPAEVLKPLKKRGESHLSAARFVGQPARLPKRRLKKDTTTHTSNSYKQL